MSLQVSATGCPGTQGFGLPLTHWLTVVWQAPVPQVWVPGFTLVHCPGVVPVQVPGVGSWHRALQVIVPGPWAVCAVHSCPAERQAPAPLQVVCAALTSALRKQTSPTKP